MAATHRRCGQPQRADVTSGLILFGLGDYGSLVMKSLDNQENSAPGIGRALVFRAKALALQARRAAREAISNEAQHWPANHTLSAAGIVAESRTPLWTAHEDAEKVLIVGKIHNLRLAIRQLNGVEVPGGRVFSFWKQIKRTTRWRGYVAGRELREGCLIPNIGGGLCQLSNALYDAALRAGFEIVERHGHSQVIPGSLAEVGRDATVFWNYVDLRFKSTHAFRAEAELTVDSLVIRFRSERVNQRPHLVLPTTTLSKSKKSVELGSCLTCGTEDCFRQVKVPASRSDFGRTAYLLDEYWPEFDRYVSATNRDADLLCLPLDGKRFRRPNYRWSTTGFGTVKQSKLLTLQRAYQSRKLASQGAARQRALLAANEKLARRYASLISYDVTHLTVMQQLLPFLWRDGHLGGRTFDVLMTSLPLAVLQKRLDAAFRLHPESRTLADFRADVRLLAAESEALQQARKIITPHTEIAALYPEKAELLDWDIPAAAIGVKTVVGREPQLVFPAATVGRKGAYELRAAIRELGVQLRTMGPLLEGKDFWEGMRVHQSLDVDWLKSATAVVLPSFVEHRPRRLLEAVAAGVPVIASTACGLENVSGVTTVPAGDVESLRAAIERVISGSSHLTITSKKNPPSESWGLKPSARSGASDDSVANPYPRTNVKGLHAQTLALPRRADKQN